MTYAVNFTGNGEGTLSALPLYVIVGIGRDILPHLRKDPWGGEPITGPLMDRRMVRYWSDGRSGRATVRYTVFEADDTPGEGEVWVTGVDWEQEDSVPE